MDLGGNEIPDSTSTLGGTKLEHEAHKCEVIEINSDDDDSDNPEVINILSDDDEDDNFCEIVEIISEDKKDNSEIVEIFIKNEPGRNDDVVEIHIEDENGNPETVKTESEDSILVSVANYCSVHLGDENINPEAVKTESEDDNLESRVNYCVVKAENLISVKEDSKKVLTPLRNCFVDLHNSVDQSVISNCKKCIKLSLKSNHGNVPNASSNPRLECNLCHNFYSSKLYLKYHACAADKGDDTDFSRNYSSLKHRRPYFHNTKNKYYTHNHEASYPSDNKSYVCSESKKSLIHLTQLNQHSRIHYNLKPYKCDQCGQRFTQIQFLNLHKSRKHKHVTEENPNCKHCGVECKNFRSLKEHYLLVHLDDRPWVCKECNKAFKTRAHLKSHGLTHSDKKPFSCSYCPRAFKRKKEVKVHERSHTGEKPYVCGNCKKAFRLRGCLNRHLHRIAACREHTKQNIISIVRNTDHNYKNSKGKDFEDFQKMDYVNKSGWDCYQCGKIFGKQGTLRTHLKIHSDVRPYVCKKCGKGFKQCTGLYQHSRQYKTGEWFSCDFCGKRFKTERNINSHYVLVHGKQRLDG